MTTDQDRQDALVELHVLAEHGDRAAAEEAERLLAGDARARRWWDTVTQECDVVRRAEGRPGSDPAT